VALTPSTLEAADAVLSDLPFAALVAAATLATLTLIRRRRPSVASKLVAGVLLGATFWVRYAGAGVVVGALGGLVVASRWKVVVRRARRFWPVAAAAIAVVVPLLVRNIDAMGHAFGIRKENGTNPLIHLRLAGLGSFAWIHDAQLVVHAWPVRLALLWAVRIAVICLAVAFFRLRLWRRREPVLLFAILFSYAGVMVGAAASIEFNSLDEARFWIPIWFLTALVVLSTATRAGLRKELRFVAPALGVAAVYAGLYGWNLRATLPTADRPRELSTPAWQAASALMPAANVCGVLANDIRPLLVHRSLPPSAPLPDTLAELDAWLRSRPHLCIAYVKTWLPHSTAQYRKPQLALLATLQRRRRVKLIVQSPLLDVYRIVR
jgi:4-amino-4-deoxy-L-arabinose transferase-like glycosyltransferase